MLDGENTKNRSVNLPIINPIHPQRYLQLKRVTIRVIWYASLATIVLKSTLQQPVHTCQQHLQLERVLAGLLQTLYTLTHAHQSLSLDPVFLSDAVVSRIAFLAALETEMNLLCDQERLLERRDYFARLAIPTAARTRLDQSVRIHVGRVDFDETANPLMELTGRMKMMARELWEKLL